MPELCHPLAIVLKANFSSLPTICLNLRHYWLPCFWPLEVSIAHQHSSTERSQTLTFYIRFPLRLWQWYHHINHRPNWIHQILLWAKRQRNRRHCLFIPRRRHPRHNHQHLHWWSTGPEVVCLCWLLYIMLWVCITGRFYQSGYANYRPLYCRRCGRHAYFCYPYVCWWDRRGFFAWYDVRSVAVDVKLGIPLCSMAGVWVFFQWHCLPV